MKRVKKQRYTKKIIIQKNVLMIGFFGLLMVIGIYVLLSNNTYRLPQVFAQPPQQTHPNYYCLGPNNCGTSPTPIITTNGVASSQTPCPNSGIQFKDRDSNGGGNFLQQLLNFLIQLINMLLNQGGTGTATTPCNITVIPSQAVAPVVSTAIAPVVSVAPVVSQAVAPVVSTAVAPVAGSMCTQAGIQNLVNSVSQANIQAYERELVQDDTKPKPNELITRYIGTPGNQIKVDYMKQQLASFGLQATEQPFNADGVNQNNVIGTIVGTNPNSVYAVSGHIDADSEQEQVWAEAADDDASGVAVTMEAARVLSSFKQCLKSSVDFAGFNDEEISLLGSPTYVQNLGGRTIKGEFDLDQVGYQVGGPDCVDSYYNSTADQPLAQKLVDVNTRYNIGLQIPVAANPYANQGAVTDAASFWMAGMPAVMQEECNKGLQVEVTTDKIENINFSQMTKQAKAVVAAIAELASQ